MITFILYIIVVVGSYIFLLSRTVPLFSKIRKLRLVQMKPIPSPTATPMTLRERVYAQILKRLDGSKVRVETMALPRSSSYTYYSPVFVSIYSDYFTHDFSRRYVPNNSVFQVFPNEGKAVNPNTSNVTGILLPTNSAISSGFVFYIINSSKTNITISVRRETSDMRQILQQVNKNTEIAKKVAELESKDPELESTIDKIKSRIDSKVRNRIENYTNSYNIPGTLTTSDTITLDGLTVQNLICESATFGGLASGAVDGSSLDITQYSQSSSDSQWLFYIYDGADKPASTKMVLVKFIPNGTNSVKVDTISGGYVHRDATASTLSVTRAWSNANATSGNNYTVNNLTVKSTQTPTPTPTQSFATYLDPTDFCSGDQGQKLYVNANSQLLSTTTNSQEECQNLCSNTGACEMYLMSNSNTCNTYTSVSDVNMFCESGPGHEYYGNIKVQNSLSFSNVVNMNDVSLPPYETQSPTSTMFPTPTSTMSPTPTSSVSPTPTSSVSPTSTVSPIMFPTSSVYSSSAEPGTTKTFDSNILLREGNSIILPPQGAVIIVSTSNGYSVLSSNKSIQQIQLPNVLPLVGNIPTPSTTYVSPKIISLTGIPPVFYNYRNLTVPNLSIFFCPETLFTESNDNFLSLPEGSPDGTVYTIINQNSVNNLTLMNRKNGFQTSNGTVDVLVMNENSIAILCYNQLGIYVIYSYNVTVQSQQRVTSMEECDSMNGVNYNYCKETGTYYCCGVCNNFSTCPSDISLQNCACKEFPKSTTTEIDNSTLSTKGLYNLAQYVSFIGKPPVQFSFQNQYFPSGTTFILPNILKGMGNQSFTLPVYGTVTNGTIYYIFNVNEINTLNVICPMYATFDKFMGVANTQMVTVFPGHSISVILLNQRWTVLSSSFRQGLPSQIATTEGPQVTINPNESTLQPDPSNGPLPIEITLNSIKDFTNYIVPPSSMFILSYSSNFTSSVNVTLPAYHNMKKDFIENCTVYYVVNQQENIPSENYSAVNLIIQTPSTMDNFTGLINTKKYTVVPGNSCIIVVMDGSYVIVRI